MTAVEIEIFGKRRGFLSRWYNIPVIYDGCDIINALTHRYVGIFCELRAQITLYDCHTKHG